MIFLRQNFNNSYLFTGGGYEKKHGILLVFCRDVLLALSLYRFSAGGHCFSSRSLATQLLSPALFSFDVRNHPLGLSLRILFPQTQELQSLRRGVIFLTNLKRGLTRGQTSSFFSGFGFPFRSSGKRNQIWERGSCSVSRNRPRRRN